MREIKRSGYMRGTQMFRLRNWVVLCSLGVTFVSGIISWPYMTKVVNNVDVNNTALEEWQEERNQRRKDIRARRQELANKKRGNLK